MGLHCITNWLLIPCVKLLQMRTIRTIYTGFHSISKLVNAVWFVKRYFNIKTYRLNNRRGNQLVGDNLDLCSTH